MSLTIGIDIHKDSIVVAVREGPTWTVNRTDVELQTLAIRLQTMQPERIVLEPSGGYERRVIEVLQQHALPVARVHPRQVRQFIRGMGIQAKSDRLDARMLAEFGAMAAPRLTKARTATERRVAELSQWRRTLRTDIVAKTHQLEEQSEEIQTSIQRVIDGLEMECAAIEATITELVLAAPEWARARELLVSCPGIGSTSVALLLAELPELGQAGCAKSLAALIGVAPFTQQSGRGAGTARIAGGRRHVRTGLWMPTLTAMTHNPVIRTFAERLRSRHKPAKVVHVACLHKLLTLLNAMLWHDEPWSPKLETT